MVVQLENAFLKVVIRKKGAELQSIYSKKSQTEYMYQPDGIHWDKQSPLLFPFIGLLKEQEYRYQGQTYAMGKHGFAKNYAFRVVEQQPEQVVMELTQQDVLGEAYPFDFNLRVSYSLIGYKLRVDFEVCAGEQDLYFNLGGHPAFRMFLDEEGQFDDYQLHIETGHALERILLEGPYLSTKAPAPFPQHDISLKHELFVDDALIFPTNGATVLTLSSDKHAHKIRFAYDAFPYVGIWTMTNQAPFLCIEPWDGLPDTVDTTQELSEKKAIRHLPPFGLYHNYYEISLDE